MKRFMYLFLVGVLVAGFTLAGTNKAEAMNSGSAALLAGTVALIGGAVVYAAALDANYQRPVYVESYPPVAHYREVYRPARTEIIYMEHGRRYYRPGHADRFDSGWRRDDRGPRGSYGRY
jgi:hypothetical protein